MGTSNPTRASMDRPVVVLSIPDVTADPMDSRRGESIRSAVRRVREKDPKKTNKTLVLVGVFVFYAAIGILAAKLFVWFYGGQKLESQETIVQQSPNQPRTEQISPGIRETETVFGYGTTTASHAIQQPFSETLTRSSSDKFDPVVSENLRILLTNEPKPGELRESPETTEIKYLSRKNSNRFR